MTQFLHYLKNPKHQIRIIYLIIAFGVFIRLSLLYEGTSFWIDEAMLAYNIYTIDFTEVASPLPYYNQTSPLLFVIISKMLTVLGGSDTLLRMLPLTAGILCMLLMFYTAIHNYGYIVAGLVVFITAINPTHILYSHEFKHYGMEALFAALCFYLACIFPVSNIKIGIYILLLLTGIAVILGSNAAVFCLSGLGAILLYRLVSDKSRSRDYWKIISIWCIWAVFFLVYFLAYLKASTDAQINIYQHIYNKGYMPTTTFHDAGAWFFTRFEKILETVLINGLIGGDASKYSSTIRLLSIIAVIYGAVKSIYLRIYVVVIISSMTLLSGLSIYPILEGRYTHFLCPVAILCFSTGIYYLVSDLWGIFLNKRNILSARVFSLLTVSCCVVFLSVGLTRIFKKGLNFDTRREESKPLIVHYLEYCPDTPIFVYYGAKPAFDFYTKMHEVERYGDAMLDISTGNSWTNHVRKNYGMYLKELDNLMKNKAKIAIIFSHFRRAEHDQTLKLMKSRGDIVPIMKKKGAVLYVWNRNYGSS